MHLAWPEEGLSNVNNFDKNGITVPYDHEQVRDKVLAPAFNAFKNWCRNNQSELNQESFDVWVRGARRGGGIPAWAGNRLFRYCQERGLDIGKAAQIIQTPEALKVLNEVPGIPTVSQQDKLLDTTFAAFN